jgi:hypothetical protein
VIAGLNVEETVSARSGLFKPWERFRRNGETDRIERRELVVMITPRIVHTPPQREVEELPLPTTEASAALKR